MADKSGVATGFRHLRAEKGKPPVGTVAFQLVHESKKLVLSVSFCSPKDHFSKKMGRELAKVHLDKRPKWIAIMGECHPEGMTLREETAPKLAKTASTTLGDEETIKQATIRLIKGGAIQAPGWFQRRHLKDK